MKNVLEIESWQAPWLIFCWTQCLYSEAPAQNPAHVNTLLERLQDWQTCQHAKKNTHKSEPRTAKNPKRVVKTHTDNESWVGNCPLKLIKATLDSRWWDQTDACNHGSTTTFCLDKAVVRPSNAVNPCKLGRDRWQGGGHFKHTCTRLWQHLKGVIVREPDPIE